MVVRENFPRSHLPANMTCPQCSLIVMEACVGARSYRTNQRDQGDEVRLISAPSVTPFRKSKESGFIYTEAKAQAVVRDTKRFVPAKTEVRLDLRAMHRIRSSLMTVVRR